MPTSFRHYEPEERGGYAPSASNNGAEFGGSETRYSTKTRSINAAASRTGTGRAGVPAQQLQRFDALLRLPENRECFDCGTKQPRWASTNLGIFFCLRCAGIHRSMGTHVSKVKSVNMDAWVESMMLVVEHIGNARGRLLYEYNMPPSARVTNTTETAVVERVIRSKYERKLYYHPRFAELVAQFMETPMEAASSSGTTTLASSPGSNAPPCQGGEPGQTQPQGAVLEELWGAPVSSPNTNQPSQEATQGATGARTNVAELFSAYPTHGAGMGYAAAGGGAHSPPTAWGETAGPLSSVPPVSVNNDSGWFESQFGGAASIVLGPASGGAHSGAPLPNTLQSASSPQTAHDNTGDLFTGGNESAGCSKDEILSLFRTAPVAGAYGQTSSGSTANTSGHPLAW
ncbi:putative GTPase activating protein for Arf family protein [Leishmania donovani]|nr:putative GTPase activating protein for Arf family protein [Leishmania donovani]